MQVLRRRRLGTHRHRRSGGLSRDHGVPPPRPLRRAHGFRLLPHLRRAQALAGEVLRHRSALEERRRRGPRRRLRRRLGLRAHLGRGVAARPLLRNMSAPAVEFIVTGDEVMRGVIADTNTALTASRLYPLGFALRRTVVVGDREEDIVGALRETAARADFCIVSGGLGPPSHDLTPARAAPAAGVPMRRPEPGLPPPYPR